MDAKNPNCAKSTAITRSLTEKNQLTSSLVYRLVFCGWVYEAGIDARPARRSSPRAASSSHTASTILEPFAECLPDEAGSLRGGAQARCTQDFPSLETKKPARGRFLHPNCQRTESLRTGLSSELIVQVTTREYKPHCSIDMRPIQIPQANIYGRSALALATGVLLGAMALCR